MLRGSLVHELRDGYRRWGTRRKEPPAALVDLVRRLRPVRCGHELIRIGGERDGGYLLPDDLAGIEACFSPGVGPAASFELDLAARGIPSHLADASVERPPVDVPGATFDRLWLASRTDGNRITLGDWMRRYRPESRGDLLLQMDIEGAEYEVLPEISASDLARFRIVVLEFHQLHLLADPFVFRLFLPAFEKLLMGFAPVHLHPNNNRGTIRYGSLDLPRCVEMTFLRRDRIRPGGPEPVLPHPLDRECVPGRPPVRLSKAWGGRG